MDIAFASRLIGFSTGEPRDLDKSVLNRPNKKVDVIQKMHLSQQLSIRMSLALNLTS